MARNYQPSLQVQMQKMAVYLARWAVLLRAGMTAEQAAAVAALEAALIAAREALGEPPIQP